MDTAWDVVVVGAGPAGLGLAAACAARGLRCLCVAPDVFRPWENNYGTWVDELEPVGLTQAFSRIWSKAEVQFDGGVSYRLERPYGRIDGEKLRALLRAQAPANRLSFQEDRVLSAVQEGTLTRVVLETGLPVLTRILVDAAGARSSLLERAGAPASALQVAYGVLARVPRHPYSLDTIGFMDFRRQYQTEYSGPPSFLYAMPISETEVFLEETSLVSRPPLTIELLQQRLHERLKALDITIDAVSLEERCFIPMDSPLPVIPQPILGFGAAAGMIHPGSGFSLSISLRLAPAVAEVLAEGLLRSQKSPGEVVAEAWKVVWTPERLRLRRVHSVGMELFVRSSARALRLFLGTFFKAPPAFWKAYLSGTATPGELIRALFRPVGP